MAKLPIHGEILQGTGRFQFEQQLRTTIKKLGKLQYKVLFINLIPWSVRHRPWRKNYTSLKDHLINMEAKKVRIVLSLINVAVMLVLITDTFLLPVKQEYRILKDKDSEKTSRYHSNSYMTYFLTDEQGKEYSVPHDFYLVLDIGEKFIISKTMIFGKTIFINYKTNIPSDRASIGVINGSWFGNLITFLIIALAFLLLFYPKIFKTETRANQTSLTISSFTAAALFFYFYFQA